MFNVHKIRGDELTDELAVTWEQIRATNPRLYSPFYSSDFTRVVCRVRPDVEIAVIEQDHRVVGLLPFHRIGKTHAIPVGGKMNDAHGLIASTDSSIDMWDLLAKCGLRSWDFHALFWPTVELQKCSFTKVKSYMACLDQTEQNYRQVLESSNYTIAAHRRKSQKLAKNFPTNHLEFQSSNFECLEKLIQLKSDQYRRTHIFDIFSVKWTVDLVKEFFSYPGRWATGCLSVLYADDQKVIAMHFGIREGDLLHYWFPVYSTEFGQYSPGTELFLRIAEEASANGIRRIDLGYGEQSYKEKLVNTIDEALVGTISASGWVWEAKRCQYLARECVKHVFLKNTIKRSIRAIWPSLGRSQYC